MAAGTDEECRPQIGSDERRECDAVHGLSAFQGLTL